MSPSSFPEIVVAALGRADLPLPDGFRAGKWYTFKEIDAIERERARRKAAAGA